jgi:hypothetical protein
MNVKKSQSIEYRKAFIHRHRIVAEVKESVELAIPSVAPHLGIANIAEDVIRSISPFPAVESPLAVGALQMSSPSIAVFPFLDGGMVFIDNYWNEEHRGLAGTFLIGAQSIELCGRLAGLLPSPSRPWKFYLPDLIHDVAQGKVLFESGEAQGRAIFDAISPCLAFWDWSEIVTTIFADKQLP